MALFCISNNKSFRFSRFRKLKKKVIVFPINYETTIQSFIDVFDINATCTKPNKIFFTI